MNVPFRIHTAEEILKEIEDFERQPAHKKHPYYIICRRKPSGRVGYSEHCSEYFYRVEIDVFGTFDPCTVDDDVAESEWYRELVLDHPFRDAELNVIEFDDLLSEKDLTYRDVLQAAAEFTATYLLQYQTHVGMRQMADDVTFSRENQSSG